MQRCGQGLDGLISGSPIGDDRVPFVYPVSGTALAYRETDGSVA